MVIDMYLTKFDICDGTHLKCKVANERIFPRGWEW